MTSEEYSRLRHIWNHMITRCYNPDCDVYKDYGGRGITICDEWRESFENFMKWALSNGYNPKAKLSDCTIDRIDVNGNYEPHNCRWVDMQTQFRNRRNTLRIEWRGKMISWQDFADETGITIPKFVRRRVEVGMSADDIIQEWELKNDKENYMTEREARDYYKTNNASIARWIKDGRLKAIKTKGAVYIQKGQDVVKRRSITLEDREKIYQLHLQGKPTREIVKITGISRSGVQKTVSTMKSSQTTKIS